MDVFEILIHAPLPRDIHTYRKELGHGRCILHIRVVAALQVRDGFVELGFDLRQLLLHLNVLSFSAGYGPGLVPHHLHYARIEL